MKKPLDEINTKIKKLIEEKSKFLHVPKRESTKKIIMPCPHEQCRGMVLDDCICCICEAEVCFDCLHEKREDHQCLDADKETAHDIRSTTKPCPRCGVRIFRISGCDQMWCTQCHTTFSYATGKRLNESMIHNPHYFEYIFNNNRVVEDDCEMNFLHHILHRINQDNTLEQHRDFIRVVLNKMYHFENVILPKYTIDPLKTNSDLRCKYLLRDIDKPDIKRLLFKRERRNLKKAAVRDILQILIQTVKDCILRLVHKGENDFRMEIQNIIQYSWDRREEINTNYGGNINEIRPLLTSYFGF